VSVLEHLSLLTSGFLLELGFRLGCHVEEVRVDSGEVDKRDDLVGNGFAWMMSAEKASGEREKRFCSPSIVAGARAGAGLSEVVFWVWDPRAVSRKSQMVRAVSI
jgi:hypothetical protein